MFSSLRLSLDISFNGTTIDGVSVASGVKICHFIVSIIAKCNASQFNSYYFFASSRLAVWGCRLTRLSNSETTSVGLQLSWCGTIYRLVIYFSLMTQLLHSTNVSMSRKGGFPADPWSRQGTGRDPMIPNSPVGFRGAHRRLLPSLSLLIAK